jgi:hypothetical protein
MMFCLDGLSATVPIDLIASILNSAPTRRRHETEFKARWYLFSLVKARRKLLT